MAAVFMGAARIKGRRDHNIRTDPNRNARRAAVRRHGQR
jgi:hypothetical protein